MVKKLIKYDLLAYLRSLFPMDMVLLGIALLTRIVQCFEPSEASTGYSVFITSSVVALVIACLVALVMTFVLCITRFYRSLFGAEGYLSLTLPVSHSQHLLAKVCSSLLANLFTLVSLVLAWCIASCGELLTEIIKALLYLVKWLGEAVGSANLALWVPEGLVFLVTSICCVYLLCYFCLTLGQMARKNRILAAIGVFFGYYLLNQFFGTICLLIGINAPPWLENLLEALADMEEGAVHLFLCSGIVWTVLWSVIYGLLIRFIMKRKLNLE
ncbi:MAG: hypothetical protein MJ075_04050 [Oscillospiraceae bacterium]|nr:hypothetical protein [Oscillospiraceae bacterium]